MKKGFTLIELLVVIGVMAVIAAGVIATINPQQKRLQAMDANSQSAVGQVASALQASMATATAAVPVYPAALANLVPDELAALPQLQGGATYNYVGGGTATACVGVNMQAAKNIAQGVTWCWCSNLGIAAFRATCP